MRTRAELRAAVRPYTWALAGGGIVAGLGLARGAIIALGPSDQYVAAVPDDAFYYLQLARNMAEQGRWTFDGTAPTTGFHPLYAYLLVALERVAGDLDARTLLVVVGTAAALSLGGAAALTGVTSTRLLGRATVPLVVAVFATPLALMHATYLMESWLALFFAAATVAAVSARAPAGPRALLGLCALGALGSLARSDFGVLPLALVIAGAVSRPLTGHGPWIARSVAALGGAVLGLGLVTLQAYAISGELVQASVRVKAYWADAIGQSTPAGVLELPFSSFTTTISPVLSKLPGDGLLVLGFASLVLVVLLRRVRRDELPPTSFTLALGCVIAVAGYLLVYSHNADIQFWYTASFMVPAALLLAGLGRGLIGDERLLRPAVMVAAVYIAFGIAFLPAAPWPNQLPTHAAALELRTADLDGPVGAWNAGVLAYFSGREVVNLDGLVNDDVVPYVVSDRLADYIDARGIRYIVDYRYMVELPRTLLRGGYADGRLVGCLSAPTRTFEHPDVPDLQTVEIRPVEPHCLER